MSIGENIRIKRERKGLTQKALAEAIGSGENTVAGWEKDKNAPPGDKVIVMARFFQCSTDEILLDEGNRDVTEDVKALFRRYNELDNHVKPLARNIINGILSGMEMSLEWWDHAGDSAGPRPTHLHDWVLPSPRDPGKLENEGTTGVKKELPRKTEKIGKV